MFRRLIPILMMCCSCATGFVQMRTTRLSPANLFRSPSRYALTPEVEVTGATDQSTGGGTTWFVRPDGGTRYSSNVAGQCDGKGDAPYSGSGVNQHCAFKDVRMLWSDGSYNYGTSFPAWLGLGNCWR